MFDIVFLSDLGDFERMPYPFLMRGGSRVDG